MNRNVKILLIGLGVTAFVYLGARLSGALNSYKVPTPSSEPGIKMDAYIWVSNLKKAERGSLVVFTSPAADSANYKATEGNAPVAPGSHYIYRLCAMENDIIQMKDGVFYVNGRNADLPLNLYHYYKVGNPAGLEGIYDAERGENMIINTDGSTIVNLTSEMLKKVPAGTSLSKYLVPSDTTRSGAMMWVKNRPPEWSADNFGPLEVPAGCGFVLGDNRQNALDSRYWGFIRLSDIKGVKL